MSAAASTQPNLLNGARSGAHDSRPRRRRQQSSSASRQQSKNNQQDATSATHQAQSITTSLLRTRDMMSQELDRVSGLNTTITDDGERLSDAKDQHAGMGGNIQGANSMMKKLGRQDVRDAIVLRCAIVFYWMVVAYVLWSRIKVPFLP